MLLFVINEANADEANIGDSEWVVTDFVDDFVTSSVTIAIRYLLLSIVNAVSFCQENCCGHWFVVNKEN